MADVDHDADGAPLVQRLVAAQMPQWAGLPIRAADPQGWDNRTFRLGSRLGVRLPSAPGYVAQVNKEHRVLPLLAPHLPLPIPAPMALGEPGEGYPFAWSVYRWLDGTVAAAPLADPVAVARALAGFLTALQRIDSAGGPPPGPSAGPRPSREKLVDVTCTTLAARGYEHLRQDDEVLLANCPFHALAREHVDLICGMNLALIAGMVERTADGRLTARLEPTDRRCVRLSAAVSVVTPAPGKAATGV